MSGSSAAGRAGKERADRASVARPLDQIEYVNGPWAGRQEEQIDLPATIPGPGGSYVRSVRCADDGAMRYVWQTSEGAGIRAGNEEA
jgi:hypothetical protein